MAARIVNLRTERKRKARAARKAEADANAVVHGLSKAERNLATARTDQQDARLEGHRLTRDEDD